MKKLTEGDMNSLLGLDRKDKLKEEQVQGELSISARWIFPEPLPDNHPTKQDRPDDINKQKEYDEDVERTRNTGRLSLSIRRGSGLKSHGAMSERDIANPFVKIWVYNEEGKKWRYVTKTATVTGTTEPVFGESKEIRMYSGSYEARMDRWGVQGSEKRDSVVEIGFGDKEGFNAKHGVRLFETDTFSDLIMKVQRAIETLARRDKMSASGIDSSRITEYDGINITPHRHICLGFVAPAQFSLRKKGFGTSTVQSIKTNVGAQQSLREKFDRELLNEGNWRPIDPGESLKEIQGELNDFKVQIEEGKEVELHLRIIEHSRGYELTNYRYAEFKDNLRSTQEKRNEIEGSMRGWAPYKPYASCGDGDENLHGAFYYAPGACKEVAEWRKARVTRQSDDPKAELYKTMKVEWLVPSAGPLGGKLNDVVDDRRVIKDGLEYSKGRDAMVDFSFCEDREVLLSGAGTGNFRIEDDGGNVNFMKKRVELYNEAIALSNQRVPLRQIVQDLNNRLDEFYLLEKEKTAGNAGLARPKKITFENVQAKVQEARVDAELKRQKAEKLGKK
jgi:hypothetical protein